MRARVRLAAFSLYCVGALWAYELGRAWVRATRIPEHLEAAKRQVAGRVLALLGVQVHRTGYREPALRPEALELRGRQRSAAEVPRLIVGNHRTALDIGVLMSELGGSFVSRADLAEWPVAGRMARRAETIFVDRDDKRSGATAIRTIRRRLREGGSVILFPEGTTFAGDEVREFKGGAFVAAKNLRVEVLPVGLAYPKGIEYIDGKGFVEHIMDVASRPMTTVSVVVGEPFLVSGTTAEVAEKTRGVVQELVRVARARLEEHS